MKTGELLRKYRIERKLKQDEVAEYLSISQRAYSKLENNEIAVKVETLQKIAELFKVELTDLLPVEKSYNFEKVEKSQIGSGKFVYQSDDKSSQLYETIIARQQDEINYLKGLIDVFKS